jgi:NTE family protein
MGRYTRRNFLKASSLAVAGAATGGIAWSRSVAASSDHNPDVIARAISEKLFAHDGLARPIPAKPTVSEIAKDLDRTLVLGGGGEFYLAWYCGFFHGLFEAGIDMNTLSEMVVGTSAGSYMGSSLTSGHFRRLCNEFEFFGHFPKLLADLAPVTSPNISQQRAQEVNLGVKDGSASSIRAIGHAALAADNRLNGVKVERLAGLLTGDSKSDWPVAKMYTTANDCYTGERLIVGQTVARKNDIPLAHGAAASSSLPGNIGPTLLGQRYCMDGGIAATNSHCDVVAGSKRAIVVTLTDGVTGIKLTGIPHNVHEEVKALSATGTKALLIVAGTPPGVSLMDPKQIEPAMRSGYERAKKEADVIRKFWA